MRFYALTIALCLLVVFAAGVFAQNQSGGQEEKLLDIQEVTSDSGITAWLVEDHTLPIVVIKFAFKGAGAAIDPADKQGLARLLSNTMDEGAGPYDSQEFQKLLTDNNISLSFGSGRDHFNGTLKTLTKHKELALELLQLALHEPRFDEEPVERMRAANMTRIRSSLSDPSWKAARLMNDIAFAGHPYALNSGGTLTSLQNITREDLHQAVESRLGKNNLRIAVTGDITPEELKAVLNRIFGPLPDEVNLPAVPDTEVINSGATVLYKEDIPQTLIRIMQPGIGRDHPDYYTGIVMNYILGGAGFGSRLMGEIREKRGLTYGIGTYFYELDHLKALAASTSTKNETVGELLGLLRAEWQRLQDEPVSAKELENAKSYLNGSLPLGLSSTGKIAGTVLGLQLDGLPRDYLDARDEKINAVSAADIQALAKDLLQPEGLTTVLVGSPDDITPTRTVETLPNVE